MFSYLNIFIRIIVLYIHVLLPQLSYVSFLLAFSLPCSYCQQSRLSRVATTTAATATTLADLVWGFSGPAAVRLGPRWFGGFPGRRRSGRVGVGLGVFPAGGGSAGSALDWGFSGISVGTQ